jgi:thioredoxin 1
MMRRSSLFVGLVGLVFLTGCDFCKQCKEETPKAEEVAAAEAAAQQTVAESFVLPIESKEDFDKEVLKADKLVVVDFSADFCGACKEMKPVFDEVAKEMQNNCKFASINKEKVDTLFTTQKIEGVPTFIIYKDGEEQHRYAGVMSKEDLMTKIQEALEEHE